MYFLNKIIPNFAPGWFFLAYYSEHFPVSFMHYLKTWFFNVCVIFCKVAYIFIFMLILLKIFLSFFITLWWPSYTLIYYGIHNFFLNKDLHKKITRSNNTNSLAVLNILMKNISSMVRLIFMCGSSE